MSGIRESASGGALGSIDLVLKGYMIVTKTTMTIAATNLGILAEKMLDRSAKSADAISDVSNHAESC
jgi:hypothetical protein